MVYPRRMHIWSRDWLPDLGSTEPERARLVGEAVLALLDAGKALGPPAVLPVEAVLRAADDPRKTLDYSYKRQLQLLTQVPRGLADLATSRQRIELQINNPERQDPKLPRHRAHAL